MLKRKQEDDGHRYRVPTRIKRRRRIVGAALVLVVAVAAYHYRPQIRSFVFGAAPVQSESTAAEAYTVVGEVLALDQKLRLATVKHGAIAGWMPAMTMQFPVRDDKDWKALSVGERIRATVYVHNMEYYIAEVTPAPPEESPTTPSPNP